MSRVHSYFISLIRNRTRQNPNTQIRTLIVESRDNESKPEELKSTTSSVSYTEMAKSLSTIMRERDRDGNKLWYLISLWFFRWLCLNYEYKPDPLSLNLLFGALLDANAVKAAKSFLDTTGFNPEPTLLELYVKCLSEEGLVDEAIQVYYGLKEMGIVPSTATCNSVLLGCVKARKLDCFWELHKEMIESEVDLERIRCLIQALCDGGEVLENYGLLKQGLKQGLDPGHDVYAKLFSGFCQIRNYACMSEILHTMIAWNHFPNLYTYQEIIKGLCKERRQLEAYRIFKSLKEKGYAPDRFVCTTMIHGFCVIGWLGSAKKLWFEMIKKGMRPNEFTYNVMIHGHLKRGEFVVARGFYSEMCRNGYGDTTVSCNTMITGYCADGKSDDALDYFKKMYETGVTPDAITFNALIQGFCKEIELEKCMELLKELKDLGLESSGVTYAALVRNLKVSGSIPTSLNVEIA